MTKYEQLQKQFGYKFDEKKFNYLVKRFDIKNSDSNAIIGKMGVASKAAMTTDSNGNELFEFKINSQVTDRDGDILIQDGLDVSNVGTNMPALWMHNHRAVVGHWTEMWQGSDGDMRGIVNINPEAIIDSGVNLLNAVKRGDVQAVSIGFIIKDFDVIDPDDWWSPLIIKEAEVIECSLVAVGANQLAIIGTEDDDDSNKSVKQKSIKEEGADMSQVDETGIDQGTEPVVDEPVIDGAGSEDDTKNAIISTEEGTEGSEPIDGQEPEDGEKGTGEEPEGQEPPAEEPVEDASSDELIKAVTSLTEAITSMKSELLTAIKEVNAVDEKTSDQDDGKDSDDESFVIVVEDGEKSSEEAKAEVLAKLRKKNGGQ